MVGEPFERATARSESHETRPQNVRLHSLPTQLISKGTHPIYIRVEQEDGHLLWSSPVYLEKK